MKTSYTKCSLFLSLIFFFASCEKENDLSTNSPSNKTDAVLTKGKSNNVKSAGITYEIIKNYTDSITQGIEPPDKSVTLGLNHIESALNYELGDYEQPGERTEVISVEADLEISDDGSGNQIIKGEDALTFYNSITNEINTAVANSDLVTEYGEDSVFIDLVNIDTDTSFSTGLIVPTTNIIIHKKTFTVDPCNAVKGWKALDQLGQCNGTQVNWDAALELERILNSKVGNCGVPFCGTGCAFYTWNVTTHSILGFVTNNVWNGLRVSDCLTKNAINNTWVPGAKTEATNFFPNPPTHPPHTVLDYQIRGAFGAIQQPAFQGVAHRLDVEIAEIFCIVSACP